MTYFQMGVLIIISVETDQFWNKNYEPQKTGHMGYSLPFEQNNGGYIEN